MTWTDADFLLGVGGGRHGLRAAPVAQEAYPSRTITVISPFPPGGATDVVTRPLVAVT